jgi:hypothetical protein
LIKAVFREAATPAAYPPIVLSRAAKELTQDDHAHKPARAEDDVRLAQTTTIAPDGTRLPTLQRRIRNWPWTATEFVYHYLFGNGAPVDLAKVGLAEKFINAPSVKGITEKFIADNLAKASPGYTYANSEAGRPSTDVSNVKWEPFLFSVGRSTVFMNVECGETTCKFTFGIRDEFRDPFDLEERGIKDAEVPGSKTYPITLDWSVERAYR